jgi:hypothetical protein
VLAGVRVHPRQRAGDEVITLPVPPGIARRLGIRRPRYPWEIDMADGTHHYDPNIWLTVTVGNLPGAAPDMNYRLKVSPELVFTDDLEGKGIHEALRQAGFALTDKMFAEAREERREQARLERLLGGPVTASNMAASVARLLDAAGDAEYRKLAAEGKEEAMWTPGADPYGEALAECGKCHRKTWAPSEVGQEDRMTQPDGEPCGGQFREVSRG